MCQSCREFCTVHLHACGCAGPASICALQGLHACRRPPADMCLHVLAHMPVYQPCRFRSPLPSAITAMRSPAAHPPATASVAHRLVRTCCLSGMLPSPASTALGQTPRASWEVCPHDAQQWHRGSAATTALLGVSPLLLPTDLLTSLIPCPCRRHSPAGRGCGRPCSHDAARSNAADSDFAAAADTKRGRLLLRAGEAGVLPAAVSWPAADSYRLPAAASGGDSRSSATPCSHLCSSLTVA